MWIKFAVTDGGGGGSHELQFLFISFITINYCNTTILLYTRRRANGNEITIIAVIISCTISVYTDILFGNQCVYCTYTYV